MGKAFTRPEPPRLRAGIIGAGFIAAVHARAVRRSGSRVVGVVSSTPERSQHALRHVGAERAFVDADALFDSDEIDVVHVCTPNDLHRPLAEAALRAGKHVICEKPLAVDLADARAMERHAAASSRVATVPFVYRFYPTVREARARLAASPGPPRLVHGSYLQDWLSTSADHNWRVDARAGGRSRAFADIGSHWCDLVEFVTGDRISSLCAQLATAVPKRVAAGDVHAFDSDAGSVGATRETRLVDTEDVALVLFRTERGVNGSVVVSQVSSGHKNQLRFEIAAPDATYGFDQEQPDVLWIGRRGPSELATRDAAHLHPSAAAYVTVPPGHPQGYQDCFDGFVADTYAAVAAGSTDVLDGLPTFADGARAAAITDAVLRSASAREWVEVEREAPATVPEEGS